MSSTRGVRWLTCVLVTPAMSAATPDTRASSSYQAWSIGSGDSAKAAVARSRNRAASAAGQPALGDGPVGQLQQLRREQRAGGEEPLHPRLQVRVEEPPVLGDQHGGEDPERVAGQLRGVDRPERRGHHRQRCRLGVAQVVAADRVHAHRGEDPADLLELGRAADPDRAVPLRGDPVDAAEPLGRTTLALEDLGVHLVGHLDERGVRRHLTAVHVGQPAGEGRPEVGRGRRRHGRSIS